MCEPMTYTPAMSEIRDWRGTAFNQATASQNRIHADDVARRYGFRGGRVPGTRVYAYLVQPAVKPWGLDPLEGGARAHAMFSLGLANTALSSNVELGPWTHVLREPRE